MSGGEPVDRPVAEVAAAADPAAVADWHARLRGALQDLADRPNDRHAELRRVQATLALGQPGAALAILRRYLHAVPDDARALDLLAAAQLLLGRPRPALVAADLAVAADPTYTIARYNRACARARLGDVDGALADLAVLVEVMPDVVVGAVTDPDLATLRSDPRLAAIVEAAAGGVTVPG
jgi:predicted Zn-dependent protease